MEIISLLPPSEFGDFFGDFFFADGAAVGVGIAKDVWQRAKTHSSSRFSFRVELDGQRSRCLLLRGLETYSAEHRGYSLQDWPLFVFPGAEALPIDEALPIAEALPIVGHPRLSSHRPKHVFYRVQGE